MIIIYRSNDYGFRIKKEGKNYWLGYMNRTKDTLDETRINKILYQALKLWWKQ